MLLDINEENSSLSKEEEAYLKEMISRLTSVEERQVLLEEINTMLDYTVEYSPVFIAELYGIEAMCLRLLKNYDKAEQSFIKAIEQFTIYKVYHKRFFKYYHYLVCTNLDKPDRVRAKEFVLQGLDIAYTLNNHDGIAILENTISIFFRINSQPEEAIPHLEKSLLHSRSNQEKITTYLELGSTHKLLKKFDEAREYYMTAEQIALSTTLLHYLLPYLYSQWAGLEEKANNNHTCLSYVEKCLEYCKIFKTYPDMKSTIFTILCIKYRVVIKSDDIEQCQQILHECLELQKEKDLSFSLRIGILQMQAQLHEKMGNYKQALDFYKQYSGLAFEDEHAAAQKGTNELKMELAVREKQKEKEILEREILLKQNQLKDIAGIIAKKNEEIDRVVSLVQSIDSQESKNAGLQKKIALIEQKLLKSLDSQESWNVFEIQFSSLYPEFTKNLLKVYPQLTKTELRLCCLLRAEFSTKTISSLMHLENETIDQYRHRLRKKLQLPPRTDLGVFMQTIQ
ncbi:MAG: tetratricopeptide repeat protein [Candidatus Kapabacteria bacterium]|nr:tetratricopeptide repeat protein [Candidatus Kapabacteria bacterium]